MEGIFAVSLTLSPLLISSTRRFCLSYYIGAQSLEYKYKVVLKSIITPNTTLRLPVRGVTDTKLLPLDPLRLKDSNRVSIQLIQLLGQVGESKPAWIN